MTMNPGHPNLLIICSDEHRRDAMGCAGHAQIQTPNLDRLAASGTMFTNAYTPSPICVPTRASLACGDHVHRLGYWDSATPYDGRRSSWMHSLRDSGWDVASIGKLHFRSAEDDNGFSEEILPMHVVGGVGWAVGLLREDPPAYDAASELARDVGAGRSTYTDYDQDITTAAEAWLTDSRRQENPWAAFVSFVSPHYPLTAPQEFYDLYDPAGLDMPMAYGAGDRPGHPELDRIAAFFDYDRYFDDFKVRQARAAYYGLVSFMDHCVGRVLAALAASGQAENTIILYLSDHGEMLGDHGFWTKQVMYEGSAGIPMIMAGPGIPAGRRVETPVSLIDVAPTALDIIGLSDDLPGRSLLSICNESDDPDRTVFSEYHDGGSTTGTFMVRWGDWKYVYYVGERPQLFNLARDPGEHFDLADSPNAADALREGERRLRSICDPEDVNTRCFRDQERRIAELGGRDACLNAYVFNHTPTPDEQSPL